MLVAIVASTAFAQFTPVQGPDLNFGSICPIPATYTTNNQTKLAVIENGVVKIYNNNMSVVHEFSWPLLRFHNVTCIDLDMAGFGGAQFAITQTFFNNDADYEYVVINGYEEDEYSGISIISENGTVIWSCSNGIPYFVRWNGVIFLVMEIPHQNDDDYYYTYTWYRVDSQTQSITQVEAPSINVRPTIADRNQVITVELDENSNATEIQVVNTLGQIVRRVPVHAGQTQVQLRASDLGSGMHIIESTNRRGRNASKIIVK